MTDAEALLATGAHILDATDALAKTPPDLKVARSALEAALEIVQALSDPPNPYADRALRPGLGPNTRDEHRDGVALRSTPHPESHDV